MRLNLGNKIVPESLQVYLLRKYHISEKTWTSFIHQVLCKVQGIWMKLRMWKCVEKGTLVHCWWECRLVKHYGKQYGRSWKIKNTITPWYSNPTSKYKSTGNEIRTSKWYLNSHVHCSIIHNSQDVEQPKHSLTDEWTKKIWCVYNTEVSFIIQPQKKNKKEILLFVTTEMNLEDVMLSKISPTFKD